MLIKSVTVRNFLCYHKDNRFEFSDGLTLLIGDNGDGKTTVFDAVKWLIDSTAKRPRLDLVSAMRRKELMVGDSDVVSVSMDFEHGGEKTIEKAFRFTKTGFGADDFSVSDFNYTGREMRGPERINVSGEELINRCYDAFMQRFSMFQGEAQLDVLNDKASFKKLIEEFSNLKDFEKFVDYTAVFESKSFRVLRQEREKDNKTSAEAKRIDGEIKNSEERMASLREEVNRQKTNCATYKRKLDGMEKNHGSSQQLNDVNSRIDSLQKKLATLKSKRFELDLNTSLLDRMWILCAFPRVLSDFQKKCAELYSQERKIENEWREKRTEERVKKETLDEIALRVHNGELRWDIPDRQTMEQMIAAEKCWVCGHDAPIGSPEYQYMVARLEEYDRRSDPEKDTKVADESCFSGANVEELHRMALRMDGMETRMVAGKAGEIRDRIGLESRLDEDIRKTEEELEKLKAERSRIVIQSDGETEDSLEKIFNDYMGYSKLYKDSDEKLREAEAALRSEKDLLEGLKVDMSALPGTGMVDVYNRVNQCFSKIHAAFKGAREENLTQFLKALEEVANDYLGRLNVDDFHGIVRLRRSVDADGEVVASIELQSEDGSIIHHPSGSQETTMYMSVLFAISELTTKEKKENYPLFFDAPTSTFDASKVGSFYNVVDALDKQCIITTKDFVFHDGRLDEGALDRLSCRVYRIKKAKGFIKGAIDTVRSEVDLIKR